MSWSCLCPSSPPPPSPQLRPVRAAPRMLTDPVSSVLCRSPCCAELVSVMVMSCVEDSFQHSFHPVFYILSFCLVPWTLRVRGSIQMSHLSRAPSSRFSSAPWPVLRCSLQLLRTEFAWPRLRAELICWYMCNYLEGRLTTHPFSKTTVVGDPGGPALVCFLLLW